MGFEPPIVVSADARNNMNAVDKCSDRLMASTLDFATRPLHIRKVYSSQAGCTAIHKDYIRREL